MEIEVPACNICYEVYDSGLHDKIKLDCGHDLCEQCFFGLSKFSNEKINICCPNCRMDLDVSQQMMSKTKSKKDLVELFNKISTQSQEKQMCEKCCTSTTNIGCVDCGIKLCEKCWDQIHCIGKLLAHAKVPVKHLGNDLMCKHHPNYIRDIVNMENDTLICQMCERSNCFRTSQSYKFRRLPIYNIGSSYKDKIQNRISILTNTLEQSCEIISDINNFLENYSDDLMEEAISAVCQACNEARDKITRMQESRISEIELLAKNQKSKLSIRTQNLTNNCIKLAKVIKESTDLMNCGNDFVLMLNYNDINKELEKLCEKSQRDTTKPQFKKIDVEKYIERELELSLAVSKKLYDLPIIGKNSEEYIPQPNFCPKPAPIIIEDSDVFIAPATGKITFILIGGGAAVNPHAYECKRGNCGEIVVGQMDVIEGDKIRVYIGKGGKFYSESGSSTFFKHIEAKGGCNTIGSYFVSAEILDIVQRHGFKMHENALNCDSPSTGKNKYYGWGGLCSRTNCSHCCGSSGCAIVVYEN